MSISVSKGFGPAIVYHKSGLGRFNFLKIESIPPKSEYNPSIEFSLFGWRGIAGFALMNCFQKAGPKPFADCIRNRLGGGLV